MVDFNFPKKKDKYPGITIRMPYALYDEIKDIAVQEQSKLADVGRVLLEAGLKEYKKWQAKK